MSTGIPVTFSNDSEQLVHERPSPVLPADSGFATSAPWQLGHTTSTFKAFTRPPKVMMAVSRVAPRPPAEHAAE